ncbi:MAG: NAD+ synthase [Aquabacterium sp.]|nr:NAD+ synthase [Aquabacterium sp.]
MNAVSSATPPAHALEVALLQLNPIVGDLMGNAQDIINASRQAYADGARLVVTPEMALCGYPPEDLLLRPAFMQACEDAVGYIAQQLSDLPDLHLVLGHPLAGPGDDVRTRSWAVSRRLNAASLIRGGQIVASYAKRELPNYQVFDERRYFVGGREAGLGPVVCDIMGWRVGLLICEDAWFEEPAQAAAAQGAQALVVINASPYHAGKRAEREARMSERAQALGMPLVYAHMVGGQDEVVFDGASFAVDAQGRVAARASSFEVATLHLSLLPQGQIKGLLAPELSPEAEIWAALVCGVRDYLGKNGFPQALIGLSGGIDSALVLAIAVDALGADKVRTVMMPSPYTADISWIDAKDMADRLGVRHDEIAIAPMFNDFNKSLAPLFVGRVEDTTEENIQARIRGTLLMALSNKTGAIVLTTGNKSELATGYCTLYGDMAGGFAVIKDLAKTLVYRLSRWRNEQAALAGQVEPIPSRIITRPPSAELRPDQTDQDSLPEYDVLDAILERYMELDQSIEDIIGAGFNRADVDKVTRLIKINEYKRRQAPIGIRITHRAFGRDWRYPITSRFRA